MKNIQTTIIFVLFFSSTIFAQGIDNFFKKKNTQIDSLKYNIEIENSNFFRNYEYSNNFIRGYTLIGYGIKPKFVFSPYSNVRLKAGFYTVKYFGTSNFSFIKPVFSLEYCPTTNLKVIFGELYGNVNHSLSTQIIDFETCLTNDSENGLQVIFDNKTIKSDLWLNWKQFIFQNSSYPEMFEAGVSNNFILFEENKKHNLSLSLSAIAHHIGGQIDTSNTPVETVVNSTTGFIYKYNLKKKYINNIKLSTNYFLATDISPQKKLHYKLGYGILSNIEFENSWCNFKIQYWHSNKYFSKSGNPYYHSESIKYQNHFEDNRSVIITSLFLKKVVYNDFKIGLSAESYYDVINQTLDYSYGFYMNSNFKLFKK